jgi:sterol desaturase/sphingolipid hydroxylase (fatty acid hydroxylase superfamily)
MEFTSQDYEIGAFFALVLVFEACERLWPARSFNRTADLKLDVLSFGCALLFNRLATGSLDSLAGSIAPLSLLHSTQALQELPTAVKLVIAIVIVDFVIYWIHRAQHRTALLWRTHAWHHSVEQLYWFSGFRTSFLHSFLYNIPQVLVPVLILRMSPAEAGIGYAFALLFQFWMHSNLNIKFRPLEWLIVTPDYHRIHHSATDWRGSNLGAILRIWDRMFGTYVDPAGITGAYPLGLVPRTEQKAIPRMLIGV